MLVHPMCNGCGCLHVAFNLICGASVDGCVLTASIIIIWLEVFFCRPASRSTQSKTRHTMSHFTMKNTFTVYRDGVKYGITIPPKHIKEEGEVKYMHMSNRLSYVNSLLIGRSVTSARSLARTDVIQKLLGLRNEKLDNIIKDMKPQDQLSIFEEPTVKRTQIKTKVDVPSSVVVKAPAIGDNEGRFMRVLMSWKRTAPLYIEMDVNNLDYMRDACEWQLCHANLKRRRVRKKSPNEQDLPEEPESRSVESADEEDHPNDLTEEESIDAIDASALEEQSFDAAIATESLDAGIAASAIQEESFDATIVASSEVDTASVERDASRPTLGKARVPTKITDFFGKKF